MSKDHRLNGSWKTGFDFSALDVVLYPCASLIIGPDGTRYGADETCIWDEEEVKNYLSYTFEFIVLFNQMEFM